jgi:D-amino peptidase
MEAVRRRLLIVADIEGSSGCLSREASVLKTDAWALACRELSLDLGAVVSALFSAGAERILVKDFHRSGYNILRDFIDPRAELLLGYRNGSVPGMGSPRGFDAALFIGMHAASGTEGFLAHTMTSRIAKLEIEGKPVTELELFASALAVEGIRPLFFSACPIACAQAETALPGIQTWPIEKVEPRGDFDALSWRRGRTHGSFARFRLDARWRGRSRETREALEASVFRRPHRDRCGIHGRTL